jgi:hypothetical protein
MAQYESTASRLKRSLAEVANGLASLVARVPVERFNRQNGSMAIIFSPDYFWGDLSPQQQAAQMALKRSYEPIAELLHLLLSKAPADLVRQLDDADQQFRVWLELQDNWSLSPDSTTNENGLRAVAAGLERILVVLEVTGASEVIVVPDTNSLLASPDPSAYRTIAGQDSMVFMLLPTVLGELDRLKIEHRNPEIRDKAKSAISRIKGWRQQGSLAIGITVDRSIIVKACHSEPDMKRTLSWLDADVQDDRIIASTIALQTEQPSARIVLVTGDVNLQNKADAALIETAEAP